MLLLIACGESAAPPATPAPPSPPDDTALDVAACSAVEMGNGQIIDCATVDPCDCSRPTEVLTCCLCDAGSCPPPYPAEECWDFQTSFEPANCDATQVGNVVGSAWALDDVRWQEADTLWVCMPREGQVTALFETEDALLQALYCFANGDLATPPPGWSSVDFSTHRIHLAGGTGLYGSLGAFSDGSTTTVVVEGSCGGPSGPPPQTTWVFTEVERSADAVAYTTCHSMDCQSDCSPPPE